MSDTSLTPALDETDTGEPEVAHIVPKRDANRGYIEGARITAICGEEFVPSRDPSGLPRCQACQEVYDAFWVPFNPEARKGDDL